MEHHFLEANGIRQHYVEAGQGTPLLLLHGYPQSWFIWRKLLPALAERYHCYAPDLRGYGDTDKPAGHNDKGTMAADVRALADALGLERFLVFGHDRGARVARRLGLESPERVLAVALLDIVPLEYVFAHAGDQWGPKFWHWLFMLVPDLPEQLIRGREEDWLRSFFVRSPRVGEDQEAMREYLRTFCLPGALEATLSDYRDAYFLDRPVYLADRAAGRKLEVPALALWGANGSLGSLPVLDIWREVATEVQGEEIPDCGHYLPEEQPELVLDRLLRFAEAQAG